MAIFGTIGVIVRNISFPSGFSAMIRGYVGALVILLSIFLSGKRPDLSAIRRNIVPLALSGIFIGVNWILLFESYSYTTVATSTLAYYMAPVFVIIASPFFLREKVGGAKWTCVLVAFLGMALVSEPWRVGDGESAGIVGILLALGAATLYASVTLTNKKLSDISSLDITLVQLFVAALVITPYVFIAEDITAEMFDPLSIALILTLGVLHTGFAYLLYFSSIKDLPAVTVAIFGYVDPIIALLLSALVLSEKMTVFGIVGAALILLATMFSELYPIYKARFVRKNGSESPN